MKPNKISKEELEKILEDTLETRRKAKEYVFKTYGVEDEEYENKLAANRRRYHASKRLNLINYKGGTK